MKLERVLRIGTAALLGVAIGIGAGAVVRNQPSYAQEAPETIRIGYYPSSRFQEVNQYGEYCGFGYDYYMQIQKYTGWKYEYVEGRYSECVDKLRTGEIDILAGIIATKGREEQMLFSNYSIGSTQNELYARNDDSKLFYEDYKEFDGHTVGIMEGVLAEDLDEYCKQHEFTLNRVYYDSQKSLEQALMNHEIDIIYSTSVSNETNTKVIARFRQVPLYYAVTKDRPDLLQQLNNALEQITNNNPDFYTKLSEKYMTSGQNVAATFTKEEMAYIQSGRPVWAILNDDWAPISWKDKSTGRYRGICVDILNEVSTYSGLKFQLCNQSEFEQMAQQDPEMRHHVVAVLADDNAWAAKQGVYMTNHILDSTVVMVAGRNSMHSEDRNNLRVALPRGFYISWILERALPPEQVTYYDTVQECLDAINMKQADATYINELVASYYLSILEYHNLLASTDSGYDENLSFAVNSESAQPLLGILDKSLIGVGNAEMNRIALRNSIAEEKLSWKGLFYSNPILFSGVLTGIIAALFLGIAITMISMEKRRQTAEQLLHQQEVSDARTRFFMMISHELRTPLNAVIGYLTLAEQAENAADVPSYLTRSRKAAIQLEAIANDMLDYSNIAQAQAELHPEIFDLKEVVRGVQQIMAIEAEKKSIQFSFQADSIMHEFVVGDKMRLTQIFLNILDNSIKFTPNGGRVEASLAQKEEKDGMLELEFSAKDTGIGMTEEFQQKLCAPFEQSNAAYSRKHGGLGLGLFLTKYFLNAMNGTFEVASELEKGTTVIVRVPVKRAASKDILDQEMDFSNIRALIAGKSSEENEQLKSVLKRLKIKCDLVETSEKVLRRLQSRAATAYAYRLCVLDESLIAENPELVMKIRELELGEVRPYLFICQQEALSEGWTEADQIRRVLQKPLFQSDIFNAVIEEFGGYKVKADESPIQADFTGFHTMIVEDNAINADILRRVLAKTQMEVSICENGRLAVDEFCTNPDKYQMILMDIQMPVMNGYEAAAAIRSCGLEQGQKIPIIAVSANAFPEDVEKSMKSGMNMHLSKPIDSKILFRTMERFLKP